CHFQTIHYPFADGLAELLMLLPLRYLLQAQVCSRQQTTVEKVGALDTTRQRCQQFCGIHTPLLRLLSVSRPFTWRQLNSSELANFHHESRCQGFTICRQNPYVNTWLDKCDEPKDGGGPTWMFNILHSAFDN